MCKYQSTFVAFVCCVRFEISVDVCMFVCFVKINFENQSQIVLIQVVFRNKKMEFYFFFFYGMVFIFSFFMEWFLFFFYFFLIFLVFYFNEVPECEL